MVRILCRNRLGIKIIQDTSAENKSRRERTIPVAAEKRQSSAATYRTQPAIAFVRFTDLSMSHTS